MQAGETVNQATTPICPFLFRLYSHGENQLIETNKDSLLVFSKMGEPESAQCLEVVEKRKDHIR